MKDEEVFDRLKSIGSTHIVVPIELFQSILTEANRGYHGLSSDLDVWDRVSVEIRPVAELFRRRHDSSR